jgi:hypothetical protein
MEEYVKECMRQMQEDASYLMKQDPNNAKHYGIVWDECMDIIWYGEHQDVNLFEVLN